MYGIIASKIQHNIAYMQDTYVKLHRKFDAIIYFLNFCNFICVEFLTQIILFASKIGRNYLFFNFLLNYLSRIFDENNFIYLFFKLPNSKINYVEFLMQIYNIALKI